MSIPSLASLLILVRSVVCIDSSSLEPLLLQGCCNNEKKMRNFGNFDSVIRSFSMVRENSVDLKICSILIKKDRESRKMTRDDRNREKTRDYVLKSSSLRGHTPFYIAFMITCRTSLKVTIVSRQGTRSQAGCISEPISEIHRWKSLIHGLAQFPIYAYSHIIFADFWNETQVSK